VKDGFVSLGGTYAEPDDAEIARISKITRNQMTRLHQEIARSITFYRSEHGGSQPVRVLIAGGTASLPYIREFFQEKFPGMEVDYFNPLRNVAVADTANTDDLAHATHTLGELVGLALRGLGSCPMELNLRPTSVAKAEKRAAQRPYLIAAGVCALAALGAWWQYYERAAVATSEVTQTLNQKAAPLKSLDDRMKAARGEVDKLGESALPLAKIAVEREYWVNLIADLNQRIPKDYIWVTNLDIAPPDAQKKEADAPENPGKAPQGKAKSKKGGDSGGPTTILMIKGLYLSRDAGNNAGPAVVDEFITKLKESKFVVPIEEASAGYVRASDDTNEWAFKFVLPLKLNNPINLQ
jgi:type IV pilus assembly protein PilM